MIAKTLFFGDPKAQAQLVQLTGGDEEGSLSSEFEKIRELSGCSELGLTAVLVDDWNQDLSPWEAPPVFGKIPFGGMAEETLSFVLDRLLPELRTRLAADMKLCIGGYSLAGLFALWAATRTDAFSGVAAASPSVWFPGWIDYVKANPIQTKAVYLSLGDWEERAKNPLMATVGDCIREQYALLQADHSVTLEWNPGNHFQNSEKRTARAFCWIAATVS